MVRAVALVCSIVASLGVASASPPRVAAADAAPPRVAIVPGIAVNLDTARVDALSQDLAEALNQELVVEAIGGLEVRRLLPSEGLPPDCVTTPACTKDVARRTKATQLLFVVMVDSGSGGTIQVDTTWAEPATNKTASRPALDLMSISEAKAKFAAAARTLLPDAQVREKPTGGFGKSRMSDAVPRHFTLPAKIAIGVGVVGLGIGIGFAIDTQSKYGACERDVYACTKEDRDRIRTRALIADTGFVVAGIGAIVTTVLYMTSARESHVIVEPNAAGGGTISWYRRF